MALDHDNVVKVVDNVKMVHDWVKVVVDVRNDVTPMALPDMGGGLDAKV